MEPASIFIVEDEAIVADDLRETLTSLGYVVTGTAKSGEIALEKIREKRPDLILMDIHIAGSMDGIDTAGRVHAEFNIPVIFLTAHADAQILARAKTTEPYGYILKPFDERGLQSTIEMALYKFRADERVRDNEALIRSLVDLNPDPVFLIDSETNVLVINAAFTRQQDAQKPSGSSLTLNTLVLSKTISPALQGAILAHFNDRTPYKFEEEFQGKWLSHLISPLTDRNNRITRCAIVSYDITDIKKRELDLAGLTRQLKDEKHSLALFSAMLDSMDDFVVATTMAGIVIYVNRAFRERFGFSTEEVVSKPIGLFKHPGDPFALDANAFLVDRKRVWTGNVTLINKFGIRIKTLLKSTSVTLDQENVCRVFVFRERIE